MLAAESPSCVITLRKLVPEETTNEGNSMTDVQTLNNQTTRPANPTGTETTSDQKVTDGAFCAIIQNQIEEMQDLERTVRDLLFDFLEQWLLKQTETAGYRAKLKISRQSAGVRVELPPKLFKLFWEHFQETWTLKELSGSTFLVMYEDYGDD